jgi:hypothetical protein
MSNHTSLTEALVSTRLSSTQEERRLMRRAGVSLLVWLRSMDSSGDQFEEVRTTLNATRKAIYFFTTLDRYRKGMRLRVMSPYNPEAGAGNLEQVGEVVRVQRRNEGYGVAVALLTSAQLAPVHAPAPGATSEVSVHQRASQSQRERRIAARSAFVARAEVRDMREGSQIKARTSDISMHGCYIDTLNPFPFGAAVHVQIERDEQVLDVLATVSSRHLGSGMGLVFREMTPAQREVVTNWLNTLRLPPRIPLSGPVPPSLQQQRGGETDATYVIRLVHALVRKGLLTQAEASEIFSDPDA